MTITGEGVTLVGKAAESWVKLQWLDFWCGMGIATLILGCIICAIVYVIYKETR